MNKKKFREYTFFLFISKGFLSARKTDASQNRAVFSLPDNENLSKKRREIKAVQ